MRLDPSEHRRSLPTMRTATAETNENTVRIRRLTEFATDAAHLADQRLDLELWT